MNSIKKVIIILLAISVSFITNAQIQYRYLGGFESNGAPKYLDAQIDIIDSAFLADIQNALPETKPVTSHSPEFIASNAQTNIILQKQADLYVTFVHEGAGYKNALGFYTYDPETPPKTIDDIFDYTIIFPNTSIEKTGKSVLNPGDKVRIGRFRANTGIGWFLVSNGWKNNIVDPKGLIFYSEAALNPEPDIKKKPHNVLLKDTKRNKVILGFEDVRRDQNSDEDFNDVLFYISASDFGAIKTDDIVSIDKIKEDTAKKDKQTMDTGEKEQIGNTNINSNSNTNTNTNNNNIVINIYNENTNNNNNNNKNTKDTQEDDSTPKDTNNEDKSTEQKLPHPCGEKGFSETNFLKTYNVIKSKPTDDSRMSLMKNSVRERKLTVDQSVKLLNLIAVQHKRLEMAKYLFDYSCEKKNYYQVSKVFSSTTYERDFDKFLSTKDVSDEPKNQYTDNKNNYQQDDYYKNEHYTKGNNNYSQSTSSSAGGPCQNNMMSYESFNSLVESITNQSFSSTQKTILKQGVNGKCLNTGQTIQLLKIFSFESDMLEMAKYLYEYTGDKDNYYKVNNVFSYSSSIEDLNEYIRNR